MSNIKSAERYEQVGDKSTGRHALSAYAHAQNDAVNPPVTAEGMATWLRLQRKIIGVLEAMDREKLLNALKEGAKNEKD